MKRFLCALAVSFFLCISVCGQQLEILHSGKDVSLRGVGAYKESIWVSGTAGSVGSSQDGGITWQWHRPEGYEKVDFRDIEVVDENTAIVMGIASPAYLLRTTDGGRKWDLVYRNEHPSMFLDAMDFTPGGKGIVIGDPVSGNFFAASTKGGTVWAPTAELMLPKPGDGEAFFAASGTNIVLKGKKYYLVSGGKLSRFFSNGMVVNLPLMRGRETGGANSVAVWGKNIVVAGGDFTKPDHRDSVFVVSKNNGKTWEVPPNQPGGYRSSVCFVNKKILVACGMNGVDVSFDGGLRWRKIGKEGFNSCFYSRKLKSVFLVGNNARVGRIRFN